jgi:hypothetical protein
MVGRNEEMRWWNQAAIVWDESRSLQSTNWTPDLADLLDARSIQINNQITPEGRINRVANKSILCWLWQLYNKYGMTFSKTTTTMTALKNLINSLKMGCMSMLFSIQYNPQPTCLPGVRNVMEDIEKCRFIINGDPLGTLLLARCKNWLKAACIPSAFVVIPHFPLSPTVEKGTAQKLPNFQSCQFISNNHQVAQTIQPFWWYCLQNSCRAITLDQSTIAFGLLQIGTDPNIASHGVGKTSGRISILG